MSREPIRSDPDERAEQACLQLVEAARDLLYWLDEHEHAPCVDDEAEPLGEMIVQAMTRLRSCVSANRSDGSPEGRPRHARPT